MGISDDGLDGGAAVDGTVGAIVWVRRRNGSWWPGRILGPEELPASHVVSPRSGTPVKLLGREDASVDWYNLEKSKRVKAFRCGEFDACIERAEASQGITIKKREKYARREDAILHALELERKHFDINQKKLGLSGSFRGEFSSFQSEVYLRNDEPVIHSKIATQNSQLVSRKAALSHEYNDTHHTIDSFYEYKGICDNKLDWKEDTHDIMPWIREEKDFSPQIASPSGKFSASVAWENSGEHIDNSVEVFPIAGHVVGGVSHTGRSGGASSTKRKISQGGMIEDSPVKKYDKNRKLVQVVQSSEELPFSHSFQSGYGTGVTSMQRENVHTGVVSQSERSRCIYVAADSNDLMDHNGHYSGEMTIMGSQFGMEHYLRYPASLAEECTSSGLIEATESDSSGRGFWETEQENLLTDKPPAMLPGTKHCDPYEFQTPDEFGKKINDETYLSQWYIHEQDGDASTDIRVSKWNMKGKRNSRHSAKRHKSMKDQKISINAEKCNDSAMGTTNSYRTGKVIPSGRRNSDLGLYHKREFGHAYDGHDLTDKDFGPYQLAAHVNRRYPFPLQESKESGNFHTGFSDSNNDYHLIYRSGWEADGPSRVSKRTYWKESYEQFEPIYATHINDRTESMLVDVDLKVQARYQGEHVPLVSLMSRLNGKAIIGHPLQIEVLEDGSSGLLVSRNETDLDTSTTPPAVWRTARRTTMQRVPRVNPVSAFEGEVPKPPEYLEHESKHLYTKFYSGHSEHLIKSAKRSISYPRRPLLGKSPKKLPRKMSSSNQKTRMLASIATQHKAMDEKDEVKICRADDILGGLIKPEGAVPLVTCLPMKVVFSRILEAIGRPGAAAPRVRMP